jgi:hypothetical protein
MPYVGIPLELYFGIGVGVGAFTVDRFGCQIAGRSRRLSRVLDLRDADDRRVQHLVCFRTTMQSHLGKWRPIQHNIADFALNSAVVTATAAATAAATATATADGRYFAVGVRDRRMIARVHQFGVHKNVNGALVRIDDHVVPCLQGNVGDIGGTAAVSTKPACTPSILICSALLFGL